jgi:hypothetical protein
VKNTSFYHNVIKEGIILGWNLFII